MYRKNLDQEAASAIHAERSVMSDISSMLENSEQIPSFKCLSTIDGFPSTHPPSRRIFARNVILHAKAQRRIMHGLCLEDRSDGRILGASARPPLKFTFHLIYVTGKSCFRATYLYSYPPPDA